MHLEMFIILVIEQIGTLVWSGPHSRSSVPDSFGTLPLTGTLYLLPTPCKSPLKPKCFYLRKGSGIIAEDKVLRAVTVGDLWSLLFGQWKEQSKEQVQWGRTQLLVPQNTRQAKWYQVAGEI